MKYLVLTLLFTCTAPAFADLSPASQFVQDTLTEGQQILESRDGTTRFERMCALISSRFDKDRIAAAWLGDYASLGRDEKAVRRFPSLVPGILISKVFGDLGGAGGKIKGSFKVDEEPVDRGEGILEVPVTLTSEAGREFRGSAILSSAGGGFRAIDIEYMNMSAVTFQGQEYQDVLKQEFDKDVNASLPVSALIGGIESDGMYKACP
jgi:hypothetical protein